MVDQWFLVVAINERIIASHQMDEAQFDSCGRSTEENINSAIRHSKSDTEFDSTHHVN